MSRKYKIRDQEKLYFVTFTVINCIDVFIRNDYRDLFLKSIQFCQQHKGLEVYAWCIMTSHIHTNIGRNSIDPLQGIIRDTKSFTSRSVRKVLEDKQNKMESRREWMYWMMERAGRKNSNNKDFQFWQQNNQPIELNTNELIDQKLEYIHMNPVDAGFVDRPEAWLYSSARDYIEGTKGLIDLVLI
ncbi:transposase [soil metagenome]